MARKSDFNAEEWSLLLEGPAIAGMRTIMADRGGTLRESVSMAQAYAAARREQGASELLDEIVSANPEFDPNRFSSADELQTKGTERLQQAVQLLDSKAGSEDADAYKRFVLSLAEQVASAHKEGGFLGIGGKEISEREQTVLDEIAAILGVTRG